MNTYKFKTEKKWILLQGKKICQIADDLYINEPHLRNVLNGKNNCRKDYAETLLAYANSEYKFEDFFEKS
jgi:hypothetical protein